MKHFKFQPEGGEKCTVTAYLQTELVREPQEYRRLPAVLICPGGGYEMVSEREAEPVAKPYFAAGYHVFVLETYPVGEDAKNFAPLLQLAAAIAHIRANAKAWMVDENKIAVGGFSAGGHLAASLGTLYDDEKFLEAGRKVWADPERMEKSIRPDAMILCYPVLLADEYAHQGSIEHVSGAAEGSGEYRYFGLDKHVDGKTPPAWLWHTAEDTCVPVENSLFFAAALSAAGVPFELHVLPEGDHGMSVCTKEVGSEDAYNGRWMEWSIQWLNKIFAFIR